MQHGPSLLDICNANSLFYSNHFVCIIGGNADVVVLKYSKMQPGYTKFSENFNTVTYRFHVSHHPRADIHFMSDPMSNKRK